jgi:hypothetical protein
MAANISKLITGTRVTGASAKGGKADGGVPTGKKEAPAKGKMTPARSKAGYSGKY